MLNPIDTVSLDNERVLALLRGSGLHLTTIKQTCLVVVTVYMFEEFDQPGSSDYQQ